jgi:hypothetical protein
MSARGHVQLALVFLIGLAAGIWTFVAPWVVGYPGHDGGWSSSTWAAVWVGAVVAAASGLGLVVALAMASREALRAQRPVPQSQTEGR